MAFVTNSGESKRVNVNDVHVRAWRMFVQRVFPRSRRASARAKPLVWGLVAAMSFLASGPLCRAAAEVLPGTEPLIGQRNFSEEMLAGMTRYLDAELAASVSQRAGRWHPDFSSRENYERSVNVNRARFARMIGAVDARVSNSEPNYIET